MNSADESKRKKNPDSPAFKSESDELFSALSAADSEDVYYRLVSGLEMYRIHLLSLLKIWSLIAQMMKNSVQTIDNLLKIPISNLTFI